MARAAATYGFLNARVSGRAASLLGRDLLRELVHCPREEEGGVLRRAAVDASILENGTDPDRLENGVVRILIHDIDCASRCVSGLAREFLLYWTRRFELNNLKALIRGKMNDQTAESIARQLADMGALAMLPYEQLLRTDDVSELLRLLDRTPYADIARHARTIYEERQDSFELDAALDRRYFIGLSKRVLALPSADRQRLRPLVGAMLDRLNLTWLLRYRLSYQLGAAETYFLLIPAGYRLGSRALQDLAQLGTLEEITANLPPELTARLQGVTDVTDIDRRLEQAVWDTATDILRHTVFNLGRAFAYLILRERDLARIYAVIHGKRLDLPVDLIHRALRGAATAEIETTAEAAA